MGFVDRLIAACLRTAARRWPVSQRDDMAREWVAEVAMLRQRRGTGWRRMAFAASLAVTPLTFDESGAPRGSWEWMRAGATLRTMARVAMAGAFGYGLALVVREMVTSLPELVPADDTGFLIGRLFHAGVTAAVVMVYAVLVGRWAGRRVAPEPGPAGSLGAAASVVVPLAVPMPYVLAELTYEPLVVSVAMAAVWAVTTGLLVVTGIRGARIWPVVAVPVAVVLPPVVGVLLSQGVPGVPMFLLPDQLAGVGLFLLPWTVCAVVFGRAVVRRWSAPAEDGLASRASAAVPAVAVPAAGPRVTVVRVVLTVLAAAAALVWAIGMTVWQPLSEPTDGAIGENNTYWARELRWSALIAIVLSLVVQVRGDRRATRGVLFGGVAGLAADIVLDQLDLTSSATTGLAVAAVSVAVVACAVIGAAAVVPRPPVLLTVAIVAAVLSAITTQTESPTDGEPGLNLGSAAAGSLLAAVAVLAAVRAAGTVSRWRAAATVAAVLLAAAGPWLVRLRYPQPVDGRFHGVLLALALALFAVVMLAGSRPRTARQWLRPMVALAVAAVAIPALIVPLTYLSILLPVGSLFTAMAGSPPVNSADQDTIGALIAVVVGLVVARLLRPLVLDPAPGLPESGVTAPAGQGEPPFWRAFQGS
ncbi:hypothetical protein AB0C22_18095 [Micromonospora sp. NPDC048894]|uniref:hypothetical protein n=1 Tax=Micromonospora sp. NPDC048894 TaxID=3155493 RepID=UPI0033F22C3A